METIVGLVLWIVANWAYVRFRQRGERGFQRLLAFWIGLPTTFIPFFTIPEKSVPSVREDDHGLDELVESIRRDRRDRRIESQDR